MIPNTVKNFIKDYSELINNSNEHKELVRIANESLYDKNLIILFSMLKEIGVNLDANRWELFDNTLIKSLNSHKIILDDDPSKSWSRLDYLLDYVGYQGFTHPEIVNHLIKVKDKLNIEMNPLPAEYGWHGINDYDLGWFDKEEYRRLYPEAFED